MRKVNISKKMSTDSENESINSNENDSEMGSDEEAEMNDDECQDTEDEDEISMEHGIDESEVSSDNDDEDEEENDDASLDDNSQDTETKNAKETPERLVRKKIINRLKDHIGKQLYVRFDARLPEDDKELEVKAKALSPLIIKVNRPRQRHARFCLVDFATQKDRDAAFVKIRAAINKKEPAIFKNVIVSIPRTESEEFIEDLIQKKLKSRERKIAKSRLKRSIKQAKRQNATGFTSTILVRNLPGNVSLPELRKLFPDAVDIQLKQLKKYKTNIGTITLPTSKDAREAVKKHLTLSGMRLKITFNGGKTKQPANAVATSNDKSKLEKKQPTQMKAKTKKTRKILTT